MNYPYRCPKCGDFSVERSMKEEPLKECPTCKSPIERIFTAVPSIAKCSGFYGKKG